MDIHHPSLAIRTRRAPSLTGSRASLAARTMTHPKFDLEG